MNSSLSFSLSTMLPGVPAESLRNRQCAAIAARHRQKRSFTACRTMDYQTGVTSVEFASTAVEIVNRLWVLEIGTRFLL